MRGPRRSLAPFRSVPCPSVSSGSRRLEKVETVTIVYTMFIEGNRDERGDRQLPEDLPAGSPVDPGHFIHTPSIFWRGQVDENLHAENQRITMKEPTAKASSLAIDGGSVACRFTRKPRFVSPRRSSRLCRSVRPGPARWRLSREEEDRPEEACPLILRLSRSATAMEKEMITGI